MRLAVLVKLELEDPEDQEDLVMNEVHKAYQEREDLLVQLDLLVLQVNLGRGRKLLGTPFH